jgi:hypothetical protein
VQQYYENTGIKGRNYLATEMYDVSRTCDGVPVNILGAKIDAGDKNEPYREEVAIVYSHYQWIGDQQDPINSWGQQHNNGRYQVFYNYGFAQPAGGLSPRSSDIAVKVYMNCYQPNNEKGRFQYNGGTATSLWTDDTFTFRTDKVDGGNSGAWLK